MINAKITMDLNVQSALLKNSKILYILCIVVGAIFLFVYLCAICLGNNSLLLCFFGAFYLVLGIIGLVSYNNLVLNSQKNLIVYEYEFEEYYVKITQFRNGENLGTIKAYYVDFVAKKENKQFILLYQTKFSMIPVEKSSMSAEDLRQLRAYLKLPNRN